MNKCIKGMSIKMNIFNKKWYLKKDFLIKIDF
jgi:hypothetical protein